MSADPRRALPWVALIAGSAAGVALLRALHLPAALLLGPMAAAIAVAAVNGPLTVPPSLFACSQALIGAFIARAFTPAILRVMWHSWPLFLLTTAAVIALSSGLGWLLTRFRIFPGTTAVWGASPGAATAMVVLADAHGADARLVALMQYMRVACVAAVASVVARLFAPGAAAAAPDWAPPIDWPPTLQALGLAAAGLLIAKFAGMSGGALLVPLLAGSVLHGLGWIALDLPPWLLALAYAVVGWTIGLRFTRDLLRHAARLLPWVLLSNLVLIAGCGVIALLLVQTGVDPLTAYLATSPGGADSIALIAQAGKVDVSFVMALQTVRVLTVIATGARLAKAVAKASGVSDAKSA